MEVLEKNLLLEFYENMYKTRRFEEELFEYYKAGVMPGLVHLSFGQEAIGTGSVKALRNDDFLGLHHRAHAHFFMRGSEPRRILCETLGKKDGYCKGKGGTVHCSDISHNIMGLTGILGTSFSVAMGVAYRFKMLKEDKICVLFTGDSATNEGNFHETLNMAKAWNLPLLIVIENNLYGISVDIRKVTGIEHLSTRAKGYEMRGVTIDGNDVELIYNTIKEASEYVRAGNGPMIVECMTYRTKGHHVGDPATYKNPEEQEAWVKRDPIELLSIKLKEQYNVSEEVLGAIRSKVEIQLTQDKSYADNSPYPELDEAFNDVYAEQIYVK